MNKASSYDDLKIDFSGLEMGKSCGSPEWNQVRERVAQAIHLHGWFLAVYDKIPVELHEELFESAAKELFRLPAAVKARNVSDKAKHGYVGQIPGMAYEALCIEGAHHLQDVEAFAGLMWPPQGNATFSKTVHSYAKHLSELEQMVRRMMMEEMLDMHAIESYFDGGEKNDATTQYSFRLAEYGTCGNQDEEKRMALMEHTDPTMLSIVCQHRVAGLDVKSNNGDRIRVLPSPTCFTVLIGESFQAWSNGRVKPTYHRVHIKGHETRYSAIFASYPKDGYSVEAPKELLVEGEEQKYKPFDYKSYLNFRYSEEGMKATNPLEAYCGLTQLAT